MKKKGLFVLWGVLFVSCAGLGFVPQPTGGLKWLLGLLGLLFFAPPVLLLARAQESGDRAVAALVRNLAIASLALTLLALVGNVLSLLGGVKLGNVLNAVLAIVSTPMFCSGKWVLSLFGWACLLMVSLKKR